MNAPGTTYGTTAAAPGPVRSLWAFAFFAVAAILWTWPMAATLRDGLESPGDPLFNTWLLFRNTETLLHDPASFWTAPIFHPHTDTIAFSENYLWPSITMLPLRIFTDNPVLLHNLCLWMGLTLSGWAAWRLAWRQTGSFAGAVAAGLVFAFCPFKLSQIAHFQMSHGYWMPLAMLGIFVYFDRRRTSPRAAVAALVGSALALDLQFLSNTYYFLFLGLALGLVQLVLLLHRPHRDDAWRIVRDLALFWLGAGASLVPFALPYFRVRATYGFTRTLSDVLPFNPDVLSWFAYNPENRWFGHLFSGWARPEGMLAVGFVATLLAAAVMLARVPAVRRAAGLPATDERPPAAAWETALAWVALAAFLCSLGPMVTFAGQKLGPGPFALLFTAVPGFDGVRAPGRFAALVALAVGLLAASAIARAGERRPSRRQLIAWAAVALIAIENVSAPRKQLFRNETPAEYAALAAAPPGVVLEWPTPSCAAEAPRDSIAMYYQLMHRHPLVNGYSGFFPADYPLLSRYLADLPAEEPMRLVRALGVDWIAVHTRDLRRLRAFDATLPGSLMRAPHDAVYRVPPAPPAPAPAHPAAVPLRSDAWRIVRCAPDGRGRTDALRDGRLDSRWRTGKPQRAGDAIEIELTGSQEVSEVRMHTGRWTTEHLIRPSVAVRRGGAWSMIEVAFDPVEFVMSARTTPRDPVQTLRFTAQAAEALRIEAGADDDAPWSVSELEPAGPPK